MIGVLLRERIFIVASLASMGGLLLALWPTPHLVIQPFAPPPGPGTERPSGELLANDAADLTRLGGFFSLASLPAPAPPVLPPPDPAAALKRHRYLGAAAAGERQRALFEEDGAARSLQIGETLADFALSRVEPGQAVFVRDGLEIALPLNSQ